MKKGAKAKPRRRLDAEAARALILDATERRLVVSGPAGIRLQEVAKDAGVSHPTVLHHFGSREQLVQAVIARSLNAINVALVASIANWTGNEGQIDGIIENVAASFESTGHARVIMWLALEGQRIDAADVRLSHVVDAMHALRLAHYKRGKKPTRDDTARTIVLATLALVAGPILGRTLIENAGMEVGPRSAQQFRSWLARLLLTHFEG